MTPRHRAPLFAAAGSVLLLAAAICPASAAVIAGAHDPDPLAGLYNPSEKLLTARDDLAALVQAAEAAASTYQDAGTKAASAQDTATAAGRVAQAALERASAARTQLGEYAATAYINGGGPANLAATLDADTPTELVSRQNSLNAVAGSSADLVRQLRRAQDSADAASARATAARNEAEAARETARAAAELAQQSATEAENVFTALVAQEAAAQSEAIVRARAAAYATCEGAVVDADGVPVVFRSFGNGKIPLELLSPISTAPGHQMWAPAARAFEQMQAAAAAQGVTVGVTDSYRSLDGQIDVAARKGLYSQGGLAAQPGSSDHGWGIALDLALDARAQAWMTDHGAAFGYVADVPGESWHWRYYVTATPAG